MLDQFSRTQLLLGKEAMDRLAQARVAVFGIGGWCRWICSGSTCAEWSWRDRSDR